ncbi:MAG: hypothetical protein QM820_22200 [Minicystis sp.]
MRWTNVLWALLFSGGALLRADVTARADDTQAPAAAGVSGPGCLVKGTFPVPKGTAIHDAPTAGRAVATFTGAHQAVALSDFPADPTTGRARVSTGAGGASLRLEGWASPSAFAIFTTRDLAVAPGHVWIGDAQRVRLVQAASGSLTAELSVPGTNGQAVRAAAPCDAFAMAPGTPTAMAVPGDGRGWLTKGTSVELLDAPGGSVIFTLRAAEGTAQLFWSTESRPGFVHVRSRGALVIDAWARQRELEPLKKGEMMDQFAAPTTAVAGASLQLDGAARVVKVTHDITVRARREDKEKPIGVVESGAEIYVLETLLGWTNVLPRNLGLAPADDGGFWIPAAELTK